MDEEQIGDESDDRARSDLDRVWEEAYRGLSPQARREERKVWEFQEAFLTLRLAADTLHPDVYLCVREALESVRARLALLERVDLEAIHDGE